MRHRLKMSGEIEDEDSRQKESKWAVGSESRFRLEAMLKLAQSEPLLADSGKNWDRDAWLFGVGNGVIELRTGTLRPGKPEDRITIHTNVRFDPKAECKSWIKFLDEIFEGNQELVDYVWRCLGYCITSSTQEQCIFNAYGTGANGKSTFLEVLRHLLGPYAGAAPFSMFERKNKSAIPSDMAFSAGKRFITASETDESSRLNESRIKVMTGGDRQTARFMYEDWFEYEPSAKIWLAFNHKPAIDDDSPGMWRRVRLIPFTRTFASHQQDKNLKNNLLAEATGILAWIVRGCLEWQKRGLAEPEIVTAAIEQYRSENDVVGRFINECCLTGDGAWVAPSEIRLAYEKWAEETGSEKLTPQMFKKRLEAKGFHQIRAGHEGGRRWVGIALKAAGEGLFGDVPTIKADK
jgi:putative DNA primase/helicase